MKVKFAYLGALLLMIVLLLTGCIVQPQDKQENTEKIDNEEIQPYSYQEPKAILFPDFEANLQSNFLLYDKVYPIGWSEDGMFAYGLEVPGEATGFNFHHVRVQNLVTDEIVWEIESCTNPQVAGSCEITFSTFWQDNYAKIEEELNKYEIVPETLFVLNDFPYNSNGSYINHDMKTEIGTSEFYGGVEIFTHIDLDLDSDQGHKTVYSADFEEPRMPLDAEVKGYLQSPLEERIAVLFAIEYRGWEGPPNVWNVEVIGADTDYF